MHKISVQFQKVGSEWRFRAETSGFEIDGFISRELLDDEVGDDSSDDERKAYLIEHEQEIGMTALMKAREVAERPMAERIPYVGATRAQLAEGVHVRSVRER